jgi:ferric-dicitrate binding protein FerR (iron transport regulator)
MDTLFQKYIQDKCTAEDYERIREFIGDSSNDLLINQLMYEHWIQSVKSEPVAKPSEKLLDSVHHQIALKENKTISTVRIYRTVVSIAAVLIVGLVTGIILLLTNSKNEITNQRVSTPFGAKTQFILPDGSSVWLNSGSSFSYPSRFEGERIVELSGEAYFKVEKQNNPFKVKTAFGEVEVTGTEFNVKAYENETFLTTLESGSVVFTNKYGKQARMEPGMQVLFDSQNFRLRKVDTRLFTSWKDGQLIFRDEPLQNIITQLERWYNVEIELRDNRIKNLKFNGTIEMESFSEVLELIKVTTPIKYSFDRKTRILTISAP